MRKIQNTVIVLFILMLAAFVGTRLYDRMYVDRTAPVIECDSNVIQVSVKDRESALLRGVRAYDSKDGDLTSQVIVQSVTKLITSDTAKVTYMVFDSANNMASASRTVQYTDYEKPKLSMDDPLIFTVADTVTILDKIKAEDVLDGDISDNVRVISQNVSSNYEGVFSATVEVMNSLGDIEVLPLKVIINNTSALRPLVKLTEYITYVESGAEFDPYDYIQSVRDINGKSVDKHEVMADESVDTDTPGNYEVCYTYTSGYQTFTVYLAVVVK